MIETTPSEDRTRARRWMLVISFLLLFAVDVAWISSNPWFRLPAKPYSDGPDYEGMGWGVSQGIGLSTHFGNPDWQAAYLKADPEIYRTWSAKTGPIVPRTDRPPFLPVVIATIYSIFGVGQTAFIAVRVFLAACLAVSGALSVLIAHRLMELCLQHRRLVELNPKIVSNAPLLASVACFTLAMFDGNVRRYMEDFLTEMPAFALTQLLMLTLLGTLRSDKPKWLLLVAGVLFGLMIYCRSLFVAWLPGLFLLVLVLRYWQSSISGRNVPKVRRLVHASWESSIVLLVALIVIAPWCVRNCMVLDGWVPLGTKGPITMLGGYCDGAYEAEGNWRNEPERYWRAVLEKSFGDELKTSSQANLALELELAAIAKREVRKWISENREKLPRLVLMRLHSHFNPYNGLSGLVKLFAVIGVVWSFAYIPRESLLLVGLVAVNAACVAAMYSVGGRFFVPMYGVMYVYCALGCTLIAIKTASFLLPRKA